MKLKLTLALLIATVVVVALVSSALLVVDETEHAIVAQFGKPVAVYSDAGLYWKWPAPMQTVTRYDRRILATGTDETEFLTADKKNVVVSTYLTWRIDDPLAFQQSLQNRELAETRLQSLIQSELGSALASTAFSALVGTGNDASGLEQLEQRVAEASRAVAAQDYGVVLQQFGVRRLSFPRQNQTSVFARMRAERTRIASTYRSEGEAEAQRIRAEADRERDELLARAEGQAERTRGTGEAEAARIYAEAFGQHAEFYQFLRTLEAYEKVLGNKTTLVLPADSPFLELLTSRMPSAADPAPATPAADSTRSQRERSALIDGAIGGSAAERSE